MNDLVIRNHGSIYLLAAVTPAGQEWLDEHIAANDETQYWGKAIVVGPRCIEAILTGAVNDGLKVEF
jgi:hypothetical protein